MGGPGGWGDLTRPSSPDEEALESSSIFECGFRLSKVIHVPMVDDEDLVDTASVRDAKPLGVLRVTAPRPWDVRPFASVLRLSEILLSGPLKTLCEHVAAVTARSAFEVDVSFLFWGTLTARW